MLGEEFVEPLAHQVAPEIGGHRQRQVAADHAPAMGHGIASGIDFGQHVAGILQVALAIGRQAQAAGGARQQARAEFAFEAFHGGTGHGGVTSCWRAAAERLPLSAAQTKMARSSRRIMSGNEGRRRISALILLSNYF
jgi:hypothetical protein